MKTRLNGLPVLVSVRIAVNAPPAFIETFSCLSVYKEVGGVGDRQSSGHHSMGDEGICHKQRFKSVSD